MATTNNRSYTPDDPHPMMPKKIQKQWKTIDEARKGDEESIVILHGIKAKIWSKEAVEALNILMKYHPKDLLIRRNNLIIDPVQIKRHFLSEPEAATTLWGRYLEKGIWLVRFAVGEENVINDCLMTIQAMGKNPKILCNVTQWTKEMGI